MANIRQIENSFDFQILFESAPDLYLVLDDGFNIVAVSNAYLHATLVKREEILGRNVFDVFTDNPNDSSATGVSNLKESLQRVLQTKALDSMAVQKYSIKLPDNEKYEVKYWSPSNTPIFDHNNEIKYIIHRVKDVTEFIRLKELGTVQSKLTEKLQSKVVVMEMEIYRRAQELQEANKKLRHVNLELEKHKNDQEILNLQLENLLHEKTQLFANVSHELRTPLTLILGLTNKLLTNCTLAQHHHDLDIIERNAYVLLKHVNDLLDIAKIESNKIYLSVERTDMAKLFRGMTEQFECLAEDKRIEYSIHSPKKLMINIDIEKIQRVLLNLLSNAFKFVPRGGKIICELMLKSNKAILSVADSGPGIPKALREKIFQRFYQVDGKMTRGFGGTGLGLSIVKDFIDMHKGTIQIADSAEGGAKFIIELPISLKDKISIYPSSKSVCNQYIKEMSKATVLELQAKPIKVISSSTSQHNLTILIVEDNPDLNSLIVETLASDYHLISAKDGKEGLEKAIRYKPDLILSDVMMPNMSGDQMIKEIRKIPQFKNTAILLLSASTDDQSNLNPLTGYIQGSIMKPFSQTELKLKIQQLFYKVIS